MRRRRSADAAVRGRSGARPGVAWLLLWGVPALIATAHAAVTSRSDGVILALQFVPALGLSAAAVAMPTRWVHGALTLWFAGLVVASIGTSLLLPYAWDTGRELSATALLHSALRGPSEPAERVYVLGTTDGQPAEVTVSFLAMTPAPTTDTGWLRSDSAYLTHTRFDDNGATTEVRAPANPDAYLRKVLALPEPAGGASFLVSWDLFTPRVPDGTGCRGVLIHTVGPDGNHVASPCVVAEQSPDWRTYTLAWTAPAGIEARHLSLDVRGLTGVEFAIRRVRVGMTIDDRGIELGPAIPDVPYVSVAYIDDEGRRFQRGIVPIEVATGLAPHRVTAGLPTTAAGVVVRLHYGSHVDPTDHSVRVVDLEVLDRLGMPLRPVAPTDAAERRRALWYDQPNVAGHGAALAGLAWVTSAVTPATVTASSPALATGAAVIALAMVWTTGSRAAFAGLVLGLLVLAIAFRPAPPRRRAVIAALAGVALVVGALALSGGLGRVGAIDADEVGVRTAVWSVAAEALRSSPWVGVTPLERRDRLAASDVPLGSSVTHAHNLWLELGSLFGIFGLAAAGWMTVGLAWLAWRWGGATGVAILVPVAIGQAVDFTLFSVAMTFPLIAGLELLRRTSRVIATTNHRKGATR